jgi:membrane protease YdiL (CAAX protease family)
VNKPVEAGSASVIPRVFYGENEVRSGWRLLVFMAMVTGAISLENLLVGRLLSAADGATRFLIREVADFVIFLLASWIMGRLEGRTIGDYGLPGSKMFRGQFWQGAAAGFASITVLLAAMRAAGVFYFGSVGLHGTAVWMWAGIYALVFTLVALREEFRARGYALYTLAAGIGYWPAAIISAAYFGYSHHGNTGEDWIGLFNAGLYGLLACFLLRRSGNLWLPIGFHMAFDWGESYFYGVADSGQSVPGHLLNPSSAGPAWLSGGTVGPEGSVLCTAMIVVVWLVLAQLMREVKYPKLVAV